MNLIGILGAASTVLAVLAFAGIVMWAYGRGRKRAFDEAANAPFALADEDADARAPGAAEKTS
jgi:cytochrome c oxidase cbb3-type subunit IV